MNEDRLRAIAELDQHQATIRANYGKLSFDELMLLYDAIKQELIDSQPQGNSNDRAVVDIGSFVRTFTIQLSFVKLSELILEGRENEQDQ